MCFSQLLQGSDELVGSSLRICESVLIKHKGSDIEFRENRGTRHCFSIFFFYPLIRKI